jgi:hypothetical protein
MKQINEQHIFKEVLMECKTDKRERSDVMQEGPMALCHLKNQINVRLQDD